MMQLRHIEYFLAAVDAGSISAAARSLHVTQPTLSRQLRQLEHDLGVELFDRAAGRAELSAVGLALVPQARGVAEAAKGLRDTAELLAHGTVTQITIGAPAVTLTEIVSPFVATMTPGDPVVNVHQGDGETLAAMLLGGADLAIGLRRPGSPFSSVTVALLPVFAYVPAGHRWAARGRVGLAELLEEPLILLPRRSSSRQALDAGATALSREISPVVEASNGTIAQALAASGRGIAVVTDDPRFDLVPLTVLGPDGAPLRISLIAAWDGRKAAAAALEAIAVRLRNWVQWRYPQAGGGTVGGGTADGGTADGGTAGAGETAQARP